MSPERRKALRAMLPRQKLDAAWRLYVSARDMKAAGLRFQHPDWPETRVQQKLRELFLYAE